LVRIVNIGVLAIQGAIAEHLSCFEQAFTDLELSGAVQPVRNRETLEKIDALVIPGGESSTISRMIYRWHLDATIQRRVEDEDLPILGTCAGCVLLAKILTDGNDEIALLQTMDMEVKRNAFGRQCESFEQDILINGLTQPYHAVFIRAPVITKVWGECKALSILDKKIIAARQAGYLALSFHPELTDDLRIHRYFLQMVV
jgi:5'-phosphate synthase pdxT subunit